MYLFDFDGTLVDSNGVWVEIDNGFLARRGPVSYTHLDVYKRQLHFCVCKAVLLLLDGFSLLPQKRKKPPRVPDSTFGHPGGLSLTYVIGWFGGALRLLCVLTTLFLRGLLLCGFLLSLFQGLLDQTQDELPLGHLAATAGALALQVLLDPLEQFLRDLEGHRPAAIVRIVVLPPFSFIL